ncbi:hypothetical protein [Halorubrum sp. GN12_10-3_MGM]|uniref:hypothetical protein n=1 Tax=Halorubrum sp. GN12_10-3_MGM TaxID=2518113 RepID=UPI0018EE8DF2|nr:hypothetical protein [Halorubrum sp. GN12_10-3_MGM]
MSDDEFRQAVRNAWGGACLVCGRSPDGWLNTTRGERRQDKLSLHHLNGDDTDDRVTNVIPLCQSCHVHIHKVDEPPYRQWHRQLPIEHRNAWNAHYKEYYEGPRLTSEEAERLFGDDDGTPESEKYRQHEPSPAADGDEPVEATSDAASDQGEIPNSSPRDDEPSTATETDGGPESAPDTESISITFVPARSSRRRIRFVERDDGPGWWRIDDEWTGCRWRPVGREPVTDVERMGGSGFDGE